MSQQLHMVTSSVQSTHSKMANVAGEYRSMLQQVDQLVSQLEGGDWQGASAQAFYGEFEQWKSQLNPLIEQLDQFSQRLQREQQQWEDAASRFEG